MERKYDLTKGDVFQTILMFMLPILAGNVFQQLYSAVDTIIVGRTLGSDALASVGSIGSLQFLVFGFCSGLAGGVTVVTSQFIGAGKTENARRSTAVIYMIWAVVSLLCTVVGIVCLPGLLHILNMPENLFQRAYAYQLVCFIGLGGQLLYNVESSLLRAIGNSKVPLIFLIISSVLNIILDFVFILVFHMDVIGAAAATILAQSLSGVGCLIYSFRKYPQLRVRKEDFKISFAFLADHLRVGLPLSIQDSITGVGMMVFQSALNGMGADAIAAYYGIDLIEVLTGFKFIGQQILGFEKSGKGSYLFGFEESYGCLIGTYARDKDAIVATMALCEAAAYYKTQGKTLWDAMIEMYEQFGYYKDDIKAVTMKGIEGLQKIQDIMNSLRQNPPAEFAGHKVVAVRDYKADTIKNLETGEVTPTGLPNSNVLYYELTNDAWVCVRPSGTEPKVKFYYGVKGTSLADADEKSAVMGKAVLDMVDSMM